MTAPVDIVRDYVRSGEGYLHLALDEGYVADEHLKMCRDLAVQDEMDDAVEAADALARMSVVERGDLYRELTGEEPIYAS